jgi:hypothetical protein
MWHMLDSEVQSSSVHKHACCQQNMLAAHPKQLHVCCCWLLLQTFSQAFASAKEHLARSLLK